MERKKRIAWFAIELTQYHNTWDVEGTAPTGDLRFDEEFGIMPVYARRCDHHIDDKTYEYTIAKPFFDAIKSGQVVCMKDTRVRIILKYTTDGYGRGIVEKYSGRWGTIDYFEVSKEKFPHGPVIVKELITQIKNCRCLMEKGELNDEDKRIIQEMDEHYNKVGWEISYIESSNFL